MQKKFVNLFNKIRFLDLGKSLRAQVDKTNEIARTYFLEEI